MRAAEIKSQVPATQATGGRNRVQCVLQEGEKIITAYHKFLKKKISNALAICGYLK